MEGNTPLSSLRHIALPCLSNTEALGNGMRVVESATTIPLLYASDSIVMKEQTEIASTARNLKVKIFFTLQTAFYQLA